MMRISIAPGSMGIVSLAIDLFGINRVDPKTAFMPVEAFDLTPEEVAFAVAFFAEYNCAVTVIQ